MTQTHRENRLHIGIFGRCNAGKSTLINILTGQQTAIVSPQSGTTTDTVKKSAELFNIGVCVLIDTAGTDDTTSLGGLRKQKTFEAINLTDFAILVISDNIFGENEKELISIFASKKIPYIIMYNKQDVSALNETTKKSVNEYTDRILTVSKFDKECKEKVTAFIRQNIETDQGGNKSVLEGIIAENDLVLLVTPIDLSAPKDRMILPQVKMIRQVLDMNAVNIVVKPEQLKTTLDMLAIKPKLVITDSQAFKQVSQIVPEDIYLTGFSVLLAKEKGEFDKYLQGTPNIDNLKDGDNVLMLENCTHQPTCEDIGRVKLPVMIRKYTGKELNFSICAGLTDLKDDITKYSLVVQCGGCVATKKQLSNRLQPFIQAGIPVTNYGMTIAYINGIFQRACKIFF
ncbi:MAG: [Bacteroidales bacterium]|nr:[FeFe] hydrogenase H-cluster maturation GTPase HydF [Bacteroidales bacterium]